jgi:hypothetical protein
MEAAKRDDKGGCGLAAWKAGATHKTKLDKKDRAACTRKLRVLKGTADKEREAIFSRRHKRKSP